MEWIPGIVIGLFWLGVIIFLLSGLKSVQEQERWIIERFGRYVRTLEPGLNWIIPGVEKTRAILSVWEQTIPLFEAPIKIDFKDGSAAPKGAVIFVRVFDPYKAIYEIGNWKKAITSLLENAARSYLNGLTIDEGITMARAGYDLSGANGIPSEELDRIRDALTRWGIELMGARITDFDLEPELVKARGQVQVRQREAEAAGYERIKMARETVGALIQMLAESTGRTFEDIQREIAADLSLKERVRGFAEDLVTRKMALDGKSFVDIRVAGAEGIEKTLLELLAAWQRMPKGAGEAVGETAETEEKKEEEKKPLSPDAEGKMERTREALKTLREQGKRYKKRK